ncbi:Tripartite tricarboxylate transporter family receptor [compost metagenome]
MAGTVDMVFMTSMSALPALKSGNPRALAVASKKRLPQMPQLPTMGESGLPGFEADSWNGLLAPAGTPKPILDRLNAEVNQALASPDLREKLESQGAIVVGGSREEFRQYLKQEVERWGTVFKTVKIAL